MKSLVIFAFVIALSAATPVHQREKDEKLEKPIPIVRQEYDDGFDGTFVNKFETGNGIAVVQSGSVKTIHEEEEDKPVQEIVGSYSYTAPDGTPVKIEYIANENGFQPQGAILPTPVPKPPLPVAIARALKFIEENQPKKE